VLKHDTKKRWDSILQIGHTAIISSGFLMCGLQKIVTKDCNIRPYTFPTNNFKFSKQLLLSDSHLNQ
jgi:hypothetical protein